MEPQSKPNGFSRVNRFLYAVLTSGYADSADIKLRGEIILFNIVVLVGIAFLTPFGIHRLMHGALTLGCIDIGSALLLAALSIYHWSVRKIAVPRTGGIMVIMALFGYLAISTGVNHTGLLWSYSLPAVLIFILNRKLGSAVVLAYITIMAVCFIVPIFPSYKKYDADLKITFFFSFLAVWIVAYYFEYIVSTLHGKSVEDNLELKKTILELGETKDQLFHAQKLEAIGRLAGGVAHDFNNILAAISGYADLITRKYGQDATLVKYATSIFNSSKRGADLTAKLLAYARKGKIEVTAFDMHQVIVDVVEICKHTMDKKITVHSNLDALQSTIMGDRNQLQNALTNLAVNAEDAMPDGGDLIFSTEVVGLSRSDPSRGAFIIAPGNYLRVRVADTGTGMDEATLAKAFEPFFTTKEKGKGTGLGLPSVYGTIKSHNGYIELTSKPGTGTRAEIHLPLTRDIEQRVNEATMEISKGNGVVLFADDEPLVREMAAEMVADLGYSVVTKPDGREALDYYRAHADTIDVVILDIIMPHLGGYDCFMAIKALNPGVKVLACSGYVVNNEANKMLENGALGFIQKPFSIKTFSKALESAIKTRPTP
jgi:signal transduction histidine kinase/CheY-like chemotaxis protein